MRPLLITSLTLLLLPAAAHAGGWASAGVLNPPQGTAAGETWNARIEILQHGRTPMVGLEPAVVVGSRRFPARPVDGKPGVYEAAVVFPRAGRVRYRIDDGFTNAEAHTYVARIAEPAPAPVAQATSFPWAAATGGAIAALALALALTFRRRRSVLAA